MENKTILITGASSGFGAETARLFGSEGYNVVLGARRLEKLEAIAEEINRSGGNALPVKMDVTNYDEVENIVTQGLEKFNRIDILFNNAGFGRLKWLKDLDPQKDIEALINVNLIGMVKMTKAVIPHMIERKSGQIINMASIAGFIGTPTYTIYAASKFGVRGFTEALRREVSVYGIKVSAVYPGGGDTEFKQHVGYKRKSGFTTPSFLRLSAEDVAKAVFKLVKRPKKALILPPVMIIPIWLNNLFPSLLDKLIVNYFVKKELS